LKGVALVTDIQAGILLLDLALIVLLAQEFGSLAALLGQPRVVGEIIAGILVGPTLLGGTMSTRIFPLDARPFLTAVADLGLVMFMFVIGMELHRPVLHGAARITSGAVLGALIVPIGLGAVLGLYLAGQYSAVHHAGLVMFIAVAMAVTAFPVLARIIADRGMSRTVLGAVAWTLLAGVEALTGGAAPWRLILLIPYVAVMFFGVRPGLRWLLRDSQAATIPAVRLALIVIGLLASAAATQLLGLHFVFGAFLFGLVMPARKTSRQRGLTELVVLSVGLAMGEINQKLYSLMVVMANVTTMMTGPVLRLLLGTDVPEYHQVQLSEQEKPSVSPT
jgi:Kef-type K+ transport system membrane component KefB